MTSTTTATNFGQERLAALPNARDFWTVLAATPGIVVNRIDVGGSAAGTQTGYSAYDTKADQHRPMVEGIVNTEGTGAAGLVLRLRRRWTKWPIETKGHTAEMPWPGVWSNFIAKSGGNRITARSTPTTRTRACSRRTSTTASTFLCPGGRCGNLQPSDLNRLESYYDVNGDVGGYLKKDKLWWYGSLREQNIKVSLPNFPVKAFETGLRNIIGKGTYAISTEQQDHRVRAVGAQVAAQPARHVRDRRHRRRGTRSEDSTWQQLYWGHTYKAGFESRPERQHVHGDSRRPVPLRVAELPLQRGSRLPGHRQPDCERRQSRRMVPHAYRATRSRGR